MSLPARLIGIITWAVIGRLGSGADTRVSLFVIIGYRKLQNSRELVVEVSWAKSSDKLHPPAERTTQHISTVQHLKLALADKLASLPDRPGCYIYRDEKGVVLYVGKAINLRNRVRSYFQKSASHPARTRQLVRAIRDMDWIMTDTEVEALILECTLIKKHRPHFNIRLRDDKSYPYICLTTTESFPRLFFTRRAHMRPDGNRYFGPYTEARVVRDTLRIVRRIFGVQSCNYKFTGSENMRPCLYFHLGQCLGPCTGDLSREEYRKAVDQVVMLFEGRQDEILDRMHTQMEDASENLQFERAASMRDRINSIRRITERQKVFTVDRIDQDIIGMARGELDAIVHVFFVRHGRLVGRENFTIETPEGESDSSVMGQFIKQYYEGAAAIPPEILAPVIPDDSEAIETWLSERRGAKSHVHVALRGEKKRMVEMVTKNAEVAMEQQAKHGFVSASSGEQACMELGVALGMEIPPVRVECYDISNLQGGYQVASMVVFENGAPAKAEYRSFRIKTVEGQDDFASMKEVVGRRMRRAKEDERWEDLPDLMIIDGGKGQLGAALEAIKEVGEYDMMVVSLAKRDEEIFIPGRLTSLRLARHTHALRLVQHIRDEAHRFALSYHRKLRGKGSLHSELDSVPGIGPTRRTNLIKHFGSVLEIRKATLQQIANAPGMNSTAAQAVYSHLHNEGVTEDAWTDTT